MPIMDGYEACKRILQIYMEYNENQIGRRETMNNSDDLAAD